jgi:hypothetical protein
MDETLRELNVEELESRIAPDAIGTPGTGNSHSNSNSNGGNGSAVSNGATPQPH